MTTTAPPAELTTFEIVPKDIALAPERKHDIEESFGAFFVKARSLVEQAALITSPKIARATRLELKNLRTACDKKRKAMGEDARIYVNAVNGAYNILLAMVTPAENQMEEIEKEEERKIAAQNEARGTARWEALSAFGMTVYPVAALGVMPEADYAPILNDAKSLHEARVKREAEEAAAKLAREVEEAKERERIRLDNERLKAELAQREEAARVEREKQEALLAAEREKAAQAKREADEKAAELKKESDAKLAKERQAREEFEAKERAARIEQQQANEAALAIEREKAEKLEAQALAAQREQEEKQRAADEAAEAAALAPDKEKLKALALAIHNLALPTMKTKKGNVALAVVAGKLTEFAAWVDAKAEKL